MNPGPSRRDFLKASSAGLLALLLADRRFEHVLASDTPRQGRVTLSGLELFKEPSFQAKKLRTFGRDEVIEITAEVQGDLGYGNPFNSKWYRIGEEGFTYSGWVQPVESLYHKPVLDIPRSGILGEITVPYSDTRLQPSLLARRGYRVYYGSTHWLTGVTVNTKEKSIWYELYDRLLQKTFFAAGYDVRLIAPDELSPLSPDVSEAEKRVHVDLEAQTVTALEGNRVVLTARCSSGDKGSRTPLGDFRTFHKGPSIHMTNQGDSVGHIYDLPGVPWVSFFTGTGVALHGTYWHNDYGRPRSRGCVNLKPADAKFLYLWTRPAVPAGVDYLYRPGDGTRVQVTTSSA